MKIGIVSIHSAHNYGSVLQAYAIQEVLKAKGDTVEIINYRPQYFERMYKMISLSAYKDFPGVKNKIIHFCWRVLFFLPRYVKYKKFENYMKNNYQLTEKKYKRYEDLIRDNKKYDAVFVGSDQVWNTDITEGFDDVYFLNFLPKDTRKVSYAASVARKTIDERYIEKYKKALSSFSAISVREEAGKELLSTILAKEITVSIDPTLLINKEKWITLSKKSNIKLPEKYIFTYVLQDNPELVKTVNYISKQLNIPVYSIGKKKRFNNEKLFSSAGPEDFLKMINNATFVVTNSFHGTVFSILFNKQNCIIPHLTTGDRMINLLKKLKIDDRIITKYNEKQIDFLIKNNPDYEKAIKELDKEKAKAILYINKALKG